MSLPIPPNRDREARSKRQKCLFDFDEYQEDHCNGSLEDLSNTDEKRLRLIYDFAKCCKDSKLGVSINTHSFLITPDPKNPINFWHYEPQHEEDKAPTR